MSIKKIPMNIKSTSGLPLPAYNSEEAAGFDLLADIHDDIVIKPGERAVIPTGIYIEFPAGYELQIRGRSGLAANHGILPANGIGTIDSDYRGEIKVILLNAGQEPFIVQRGDRVAQGVISKYEQVVWNHVDEINETRRGSGGLGSTDRKVKHA